MKKLSSPLAIREMYTNIFSFFIVSYCNLLCQFDKEKNYNFHFLGEVKIYLLIFVHSKVGGYSGERKRINECISSINSSLSKVPKGSLAGLARLKPPARNFLLGLHIYGNPGNSPKHIYRKLIWT